MTEMGVERWINCNHGIEFSVDGIDPDSSYPPAPGQLFSNFGCDNPIVVVDSQVIEEFPDPSHKDGPKITLAVVFHGSGRLEDLTVRSSLILACGSCPFFNPKT